MQTLEMEKIYHVHNNGKYLGEFKTHLPIRKDTDEVVVEFHNIDNDDVLYLTHETHENKKRNNTSLLKFSRKNSDEHVIVCYTLSDDNLYFKRDHSFYKKYQRQVEKHYSSLKDICCHSQKMLDKPCIHSTYQDFLSLNIGDIITCDFGEPEFCDWLVTKETPLVITNINKKGNCISCVRLDNQSSFMVRIFDVSAQKNIIKLLCEVRLKLGGDIKHFLLPPNITKLT